MKQLTIDAALYGYMLDHTLREPEVLRRLREETATHPRAAMQIEPLQGQFMQLLVRLLGARRTLDIGVFTGYSALAVALALPADGQVVGLDISEEYTAIGARYWAEAGVADRIELRLAPALVSLDALLAAGEADAFDFAFLDADKVNYHAYYERALKLVRPGGLVVIDNVLWDGLVADPMDQAEDTVALRAFNTALHQDPRIDLAMVPIADGLTLARRRA